MEVLIPIFAIGGLALSMSDKSSLTKNANRTQSRRQENTMDGFSNMQQLHPNEYPANNNAKKNTAAEGTNYAPYNSPNNATAKYFDQNNYYQNESRGKNVGNSINQVHSLTGAYVDETTFSHNNMTPFYGGKTTQQTMEGTRSDAILDKMAGGGSQYIKKQEQAPLFKPQDNVHLAHGQPNMSDFYQSRVTPSQKFNNIKPFESEQVAPGLNAGYSSQGSGGFNSGMDARETYMPKSVDELRVATNPKMEYSLDNHQGPAASYVKNVGLMGKMEQHKPDTFFEQSQDRWLKTTSGIKAQTSRAQQEVHDTARMQTEAYTGVAGSIGKGAIYMHRTYVPSQKQGSNTTPITNLRGPDAGINSQAITKSYQHYTNNRDLNNSSMNNNKDEPSYGSKFSSAIGAVIAPITQMLNPTKKQETVNNMRVYGNAGTTVGREQTVNPNDVVSTTVKETTLYAPNTFIQNQSSDAYLVTQHQPLPNQRDTTTMPFTGNANGASTRFGQTSYMANYNQTNNETKENTLEGRTSGGSMSLLNSNMHVNTARRDNDRNNNRMWAPSNMPQKAMSKEFYGKVNESPKMQQDINIERMSPDLLNAFKSNPYTQPLSSTGLR